MTGKLAPPSVTSNRAERPSRTRLPSLTKPPIRNRLPGSAGFAASSLGVTKNTIDSRKAVNARPAASDRIANTTPISTRRRCRRLMTGYSLVLPGRLQAFECRSHHAKPRRAFRCVIHERLPNGLRVLQASVLLGREPEEETRLGMTSIKNIRALEGGPCIGGHHAICPGDKSLAKIDFAVRVRAEQAERVLARLRRLVRPPQAEINRREDFPTSLFIGLLGQVGFNSSHQKGDVLVFGSGGKARR